jgi:hypothetical protein
MNVEMGERYNLEEGNFCYCWSGYCKYIVKKILTKNLEIILIF